MASATLENVASVNGSDNADKENFLTVDGKTAVKSRHFGKIVKRNLEQIAQSFSVLREENVPIAEWTDLLREEFSLPEMIFKPATEETSTRSAKPAESHPLTAQAIYSRAGGVIDQLTKDKKAPKFELPKIPEFGDVQTRPVEKVVQSLRERIKAKREAMAANAS